RCCGYKFCHIC
uniref:Conotoxin ar5a n=1 Tax=Conus araneosus TaxID=101286 RepID=CT10A_CONAO|nr:RecName: Full=Conotoxin ar5a [Conus araneosus]